MITLNNAERKALLDFLEELLDNFSCESCNDYEVPDTPENRKMIAEAETFIGNISNVNDYEPSIYKGKITVDNFVLLSYLIELIRFEAKNGMV